MKKFMNHCLQVRRLRWSILAVAFAAVLVLTQGAASNDGQPQYKLGGAWLGNGGGNIWNCIQIPTDPSGLSAALHVKFPAYGAGFAGLAAAFGADTWSDYVGEGVMVNRDTEKWTLVGYAQKVNANKELEICAILVGSGTFQYKDRNHAMLYYTIKVYAASKDADHDGMPDTGAQPDVVVPGLMDTVQRVPVLP